MSPQERLRYHVTGAIERGEGAVIVGKPAAILHYRIYSGVGSGGFHTPGFVGKPYANRRRAQTRADKLNLEYGAHRYSVRTVYAEEA